MSDTGRCPNKCKGIACEAQFLYGPEKNLGWLYGHNFIEKTGFGEWVLRTNVPLDHDYYPEPARYHNIGRTPKEKNGEILIHPTCRNIDEAGSFRYSLYKPPVCEFKCDDDRRSVDCLSFEFVSSGNGTFVPGCVANPWKDDEISYSCVRNDTVWEFSNQVPYKVASDASTRYPNVYRHPVIGAPCSNGGTPGTNCRTRASLGDDPVPSDSSNAGCARITCSIEQGADQAAAVGILRDSLFGNEVNENRMDHDGNAAHYLHTHDGV
jgi:hypothetical protein